VTDEAVAAFNSATHALLAQLIDDHGSPDAILEWLIDGRGRFCFPPLASIAIEAAVAAMAGTPSRIAKMLMDEGVDTTF
jgi:hypothetical protein